MAKSKRQLADEAYLRTMGQIDLLDTSGQPHAEPDSERFIVEPECCPRCGKYTRPRPEKAAGWWQTMRSQLSDVEGWLQCCHCGYIVRVARVVWDSISLRASKVYRDRVHEPSVKKTKRERGAG